MKYILLLTAMVSVLISCKKEISKVEGKSNSYLEKVKAILKDSLTVTDFSKTDFSKVVLTRFDDGKVNMIRVPFVNDPISERFLLLKLGQAGKYIDGGIIEIKEKKNTTNSGNLPLTSLFNGHISINSLNGKPKLSSGISNGYIDAFHAQAYPQTRQQNNLSTTVIPGSDYLPEVIVIAYRHTQTAGLSFNTYMALQSILDGGGGGGGWPGASFGAYYSSAELSSGGGTGSTSGGGSSGTNNGDGFTDNYENTFNEVIVDNPVYVDFEPQDSKPAIDVEKYIKCFAAIPDAGAECSIEIMSDIPVDADPAKLLNVNTGSPGHTFLQIRKSNNGQHVIQNIGFYPESGFKAVLTDAPIPGKFVDNGQHEFNASYKMRLSPEELQHVLTRLSQLAGVVKYDIDEYNCTDLAVEVFNSAQNGKFLDIPLYDILGGMSVRGTSTPQGLYNKLVGMKQAGGDNASNITIPGVKGYVAASDGPCN